MPRPKKPASTKPIANPKRVLLKRLPVAGTEDDLTLMPRQPLRRPVPTRPARFMRAG